MSYENDPLEALARANDRNQSPLQRVYPTRVAYAPAYVPPARSVNGLGVASLIVGLLALTGAWIPLLGFTVIPLTIIGGILGFVGFLVAAAGGRSGFGFPIFGILVNVVAFVLPFLMLMGVLAAGQAGAAQAKQTAAALKQTAQTYPVDQIVGIYDQNEVSGDADFKGNFFKVRGAIGSIGVDVLGHPYVVLKGSNSSAFTGVQCTFDSSHSGELSQLRAGEQLVVYGQGNGKFMNVLMANCEVTDR